MAKGRPRKILAPWCGPKAQSRVNGRSQRPSPRRVRARARSPRGGNACATESLCSNARSALPAGAFCSRNREGLAAEDHLLMTAANATACRNLPATQLKRLRSAAAHKEVFEDIFAFASLKGSATSAAAYLSLHIDCVGIPCARACSVPRSLGNRTDSPKGSPYSDTIRQLEEFWTAKSRKAN